jgi:hypothetical protein
MIALAGAIVRILAIVTCCRLTLFRVQDFFSVLVVLYKQAVLLELC